MDVAQRRAHVVVFYESHDFLAGLVADFLAPAVRTGGQALVVATGRHRRGIAHALSGEVDTDGTGRLAMRDAAQMLPSLLVDGAPDPDRFHTMLSGLLDRLTADGKPVRIFGEMVALLYEGGEPAAALALEDLWNDLASSYEFDLLCAYPMRDFDTDKGAVGFGHVCGRHTAVANEGYAGLGLDAHHPYVLDLERPFPAI